MKITLDIDESTLNEIRHIYGNSKYATVETVINDIFHRYFNREYFNAELSVEDYENDDIEDFILNELRQEFCVIFESNGYNDSLFDENLFSNAIDKENFVVTQYSIGKIYTLSEIYHKLTNKISRYGKLVELLVSYDTK